MSIENRVISMLQSALRAGRLPEGDELNSPYVIHAANGRLLDCNAAFSDLVARSELSGTHFAERCPTRFIEEMGNEQIQQAKEAGFAQLRRPILAYDGKIHSITCELQIVALGGRALFLSSFVVEAFDIGKLPDGSKGQVYFLPGKVNHRH
jgi:hypothetical protein|tara:strand:- start:791 stop:1243 length:453 start_codon:yes stop_codon:yes gene_type:complete